MIEVFDGSGIYKPIPRYMDEVTVKTTLVNAKKQMIKRIFYFKETSCEDFEGLENWINNTLILENQEHWKVFTIDEVQCGIDYV